MPPRQNPPIPSYLTMGFDLVTVRVGEPEFMVDFQVHRELITAVSPYFHGLFKGGFKEENPKQSSRVRRAYRCVREGRCCNGCGVRGRVALDGFCGQRATLSQRRCVSMPWHHFAPSSSVLQCSVSAQAMPTHLVRTRIFLLSATRNSHAFIELCCSNVP
jgi:hypothetical protein